MPIFAVIDNVTIKSGKKIGIEIAFQIVYYVCKSAHVWQKFQNL